ncbi:MAG: PorV/PorQ family protein [bacterium]
MRHILRSFSGVLLIAVSLSILLSVTVYAQKPGDSGFLSLRMAVGARETGMGGSGVAATRGAAAIYWNPAALAFSEYNTDLLLQHQGWLGLFHKETATMAHRTSFGDIGFFFSGFYSDAIERYGEEPVGVPEGTFKPHDVVVGLSFARKVVETVSAGVTVKMLYEKIDIYSDSGYAVDVFLFHQAVIEGLTFGASLTNLGSQLQLKDEPFDLPMAIRVGAAYDPQHPFLAGKLTFTGDLIMPNDGNDKAHVGAEYRMLTELALRVGTKVNYDSQGLTAGIGLRRGALGVGYSFEDMQNDLDPSHKFALELHY